MDYFYEPYTRPLKLDSDEILFTKLTEITRTDKEKLAKIYCTLFNQDNKAVIEELSIKGKATESGIWDEKPYSISTCQELINEYTSESYFGVCAYGVIKGENTPVGASVNLLRDLSNLKSKGYEIPFTIPQNTEFWCAIDTFRLDLIANDASIKGLANKMRDVVVETFKKQNPVLLYSSTNNPVMVKSWKKYGFTVVNKETTFGNKFQAFKLI